jgi:hypothetical protein
MAPKAAEAIHKAFKEATMAKKNTSNALPILSLNEATARGLMPLTVAEAGDTTLPVGSGASSMRYIEWLTTEQRRITRHGDRLAEIVDEGEGQVALWVDDIATC